MEQSDVIYKPEEKKANRHKSELGHGRALKALKNEEIIEAIKKCRGLTYIIANALGVSHSGISAKIAADPELSSVLREQRGRALDMAEAKLMQAVDKGEQWAITMILRTLGRERGYVERQEVSNVTTVRLQIVEEIVDADNKQIEIKVNQAVEYRPNLPEGFNDVKETEGAGTEGDEEE
jgi:hypothetical protein